MTAEFEFTWPPTDEDIRAVAADMLRDGGPAFPVSIDMSGRPSIGDSGMSLRDYFAGQALAGLLANCDEYGAITDSAYEYADLMLRSRK